MGITTPAPLPPIFCSVLERQDATVARARAAGRLGAPPPTRLGQGEPTRPRSRASLCMHGAGVCSRRKRPANLSTSAPETRASRSPAQEEMSRSDAPRQGRKCNHLVNLPDWTTRLSQATARPWCSAHGHPNRPMSWQARPMQPGQSRLRISQNGRPALAERCRRTARSASIQVEEPSGLPTLQVAAPSAPAPHPATSHTHTHTKLQDPVVGEVGCASALFWWRGRHAAAHRQGSVDPHMPASPRTPMLEAAPSCVSAWDSAAVLVLLVALPINVLFSISACHRCARAMRTLYHSNNVG